MRVIGLMEVYNEEDLARRVIENRIEHIDRILIAEGSLAINRNLPERSTDNTMAVLKEMEAKYPDQIFIAPPIPIERMRGHSREAQHGINKNYLLEFSDIEPGDVIHLMDTDEFYGGEGLWDILRIFRMYDEVQHVQIGEYQYAYNLRWWFPASHLGRFIRFQKGGRYTASNHFLVDGKDVIKDRRVSLSRKRSQMTHLCWVKHPRLIRDKVLTFDRPSLTKWYNERFLRWPSQGNTIDGFAEGQTEPLRNQPVALPNELVDFTDDWLPEIRDNWREYLI
jgi:hypothetical protein